MLNINKIFTKGEYFISGVFFPSIFILLLYILDSEVVDFLMLFPFIVMIIISAIKRGNTIGMTGKQIVVYSFIFISLSVLFIKLLTPSQYDCDIKFLVSYLVFMPFQLLLLFLPNRLAKLTNSVTYPFIFYALFLFVSVLAIFRPFVGCVLRSMSLAELTCYNMKYIGKSILLNTNTYPNITRNNFNVFIKKEKISYLLDGWGNKIVFQKLDNGFKLMAKVDRNQSEWVREVKYLYIKDGNNNGCYIDKGLLERIFCQH